MYRKTLLAPLLCGAALCSWGKQYNVTGQLIDAEGNKLGAASVSLLYPEDSTFAAFSISDNSGKYSIGNVKEGNYVLQIALMGYFTHYRTVSINDQAVLDLGVHILEENIQELEGAIVMGERVPVRLKGDTLEYNAGSYKVNPDAVVEDLLRKMPGVEVDKDGNVRSMGKQVSKVLVDGKEFFGNDPKVALKNLPADAVDKIQSFGRRSEDNLFSGIDDGQREQSLNIVLKEGHKAGYFGEAKAGVGTDERFEGGLKAFRFRRSSQFATLGMLNNVNKFGFTISDYLNFNGGLSGLMRSGSGSLQLDEDAPIDMGKPVDGNVAAGNLGLNYMTELNSRHRLTFTYMGTGVRKLLEESVTERNFIPGDDFIRESRSNSKAKNFANAGTISWRNQVDAQHLFTISATGNIGNSRTRGNSRASNIRNDIRENYLDNITLNKGTKFGAGIDVNWVKRFKGNWKTLSLGSSSKYGQNEREKEWYNSTWYDNTGQMVKDEQYLNNHVSQFTNVFTASAVRHLGKSFYLEPSVKLNFDRNKFDRQQGPLSGNREAIDTLSPVIYRDVQQATAGVVLKQTKPGQQANLGFNATHINMDIHLNDIQLGKSRSYFFPLPYAFFRKEIRSGETFDLSYNTNVQMPDAYSLLPISDVSDPLLITRGDPDLKPEYVNDLRLGYLKFDRFEMSNFTVSLNGRYVNNSIGSSSSVQNNLTQEITSVNTPYSANATFDISYSRPVPKLGLRAQLGFAERWNRAFNIINDVENKTRNMDHTISLNFSNLKSDQWDLRLGGDLQLSDVRYSINEQMNDLYFNYSCKASIGYFLKNNWRFVLDADVRRYAARGFGGPVTIPLIGAEINSFFLKNQRGSITLRAFDLLDQNQNVHRYGQLNTFGESRTNTIGRYVMLTFGYKLNKGGRKAKAPGEIEIGQ